jgi:hypothetical protein
MFSNGFPSNGGNNNTFQQVIEWHKYAVISLYGYIAHTPFTASWDPASSASKSATQLVQTHLTTANTYTIVSDAHTTHPTTRKTNNSFHVLAMTKTSQVSTPPTVQS